jgi:hypothetical protein
MSISELKDALRRTIQLNQAIAHSPNTRTQLLNHHRADGQRGWHGLERLSLE